MTDKGEAERLKLQLLLCEWELEKTELNFLSAGDLGKGVGWAGLGFCSPWHCHGCHSSVGVLPAAAQVLMGPVWGQAAESKQQFQPSSSTLPL